MFKRITKLSQLEVGGPLGVAGSVFAIFIGVDVLLWFTPEEELFAAAGLLAEAIRSG